MATLTAEPREKATKTETGRLRKAGVLPLALIRKSHSTELIQASNEALKLVMHGNGGIIIFDLKHGKENLKVVVKDVQRNAMTRRVEHVTLQEVLDTDIIKVPVPVKIVGEPVAVTKRSSTLMVPMMTLMVQAEVRALPDGILVDVSAMKQNDKISVSDLKWAEGVTPLSSPETVLASTKQLRGMADLAEGETEEEEAEATVAEAEPAADEPATEEPTAAE